MSTFTWQSADGDWDNPASWGIAQIVNSTDEGTTAATDGTSTITFSGATDLSSVAAGDTLKLIGNVEGKNSGQYYEVLTVNDGADTMTVSPTPPSTDSSISWIIYEDLPGANAATDDIIFPPESSQSVTTGLDQSAQGKFTTITSHRGFTGQIGESANPLVCSATTVLHMGDLPLHIKVASGGVINTATFLSTTRSHTFGYNTVQSASSSDYILDLRVISSHVYGLGVAIADPSPIGAGFNEGLHISELPGEPPWAWYYHGVDCGNIVHVFINAGFYQLGGSVSQVYLSGTGAVDLERWAKTTAGGAGQILNITQGGGELVYNGTGAISTANILAGHLDFSQDPQSKTVSTLRVFPGAVVSLHYGITVTNSFSSFPNSHQLGGGTILTTVQGPGR